jgi:hypothetical protein
MHHLIQYLKKKRIQKSKNIFFFLFFLKVILRVQRPSNHTKVNVTTEKRSTITNTTNKVKWRDDFEHYDNDSK